MAGYAFGVKVMDEYMGRVLDALEHYGLADNTLVIVTSDHGIEFPGAKMSLTDQGVGVMLMMRGPGIDQGQVIEPIVSHMDLYPTILDYLGLERRPWLEGSSLLPLMRGEVESLHQHVFAEQTWHCNYLEPLRSIRTERYKLVLRHLDHGPHMRHVGLSTPVMAKRGYYDRPIGHEELFDLHLDPWEACNRINDPAYAQTAEELRNELNTWMRQTGDCFPSSKFPSSPHNIP
jgi:arylsulfatase A-like enzyme